MLGIFCHHRKREKGEVRHTRNAFHDPAENMADTGSSLPKTRLAAAAVAQLAKDVQLTDSRRCASQRRVAVLGLCMR